MTPRNTLILLSGLAVGGCAADRQPTPIREQQEVQLAVGDTTAAGWLSRGVYYHDGNGVSALYFEYHSDVPEPGEARLMREAAAVFEGLRERAVSGEFLAVMVRCRTGVVESDGEKAFLTVYLLDDGQWRPVRRASPVWLDRRS